MIVLVGFMGAGKTTVGRLLAGKLGVPFLDSDEALEAQAGRPIREIFAEDGESAFRALEHSVIASLLAGPDVVLALGGGAAGHPGTRDLLSSGPAVVVYLRVAYEEALARVGGDEGRPMLARPDVADVYATRQAAYSSVATLPVDTGGRLPEDIAGDILTRLTPDCLPP
ncbi:MAG: shikimate kinase [Trebonia sp.]